MCVRVRVKGLHRDGGGNNGYIKKKTKGRRPSKFVCENRESPTNTIHRRSGIKLLYYGFYNDNNCY